MHFLYPFGLVASLGVILPLLIHLWNVKRGKTLKIGSISLLGESAQISSKSLKINDWLLLVLRCLLLILLSLIIAQPVVRQTVANDKKGGWILVDKASFKQVYRDNQKTIDSLVKLEYEIRDFNIGFKPMEDAQASPSIGQKITYASLLKELNSLVPNGFSVYVYADNRLNHFGDELPRPRYKLYWKSTKAIDTISEWKTFYAGKPYAAKSNPASTSFRAESHSNLQALRVKIYEPTGGSDSKYLVAALNAISSFSGRKIEINSASGQAEVGFWLSHESASVKFKTSISKGGTLFQYKKGKIIEKLSFANVDGKAIKIFKRIESSPLSPEKLWIDNSGSLLLSKQRLGKLKILDFYSRFNPQWSDLVWDESFVRFLMPIVIHDQTASEFGFEEHVNDQRTFGVSSEVPIPEKTNAITIIKDKPLDLYFWILMLAIFLVERILSFRKHGYAKS